MQTIFLMSEDGSWPKLIIRAESEDEQKLILDQFDGINEFFTCTMNEGDLVFDVVGDGRVEQNFDDSGRKI